MKSLIKKIVIAILTFEARLVLLRYKPKIIGVTGSVGKSSTKDAIFSTLSSIFFVRKSQKSFNSEFGIPLTILGCDNAWNNPFLWLKNIVKGFWVIVFPYQYPEWLILEVGLDRPGDIQRVVRWVQFDVVVYTQLSKKPVHVEFFESPEALLKEKEYLIQGLKAGGVLVLNGDDSLQNNFQKNDVRRIRYGLDNGVHIRGSHAVIEYRDDHPVGITFRIDAEGASLPVTLLGVLGIQHIYPVLAGVAVGFALGVNLVSMGDVLKQHTFLPGRMRLLEGREDTSIIDDSYNASPVATNVALDVLDEVKVTGRKICVLGDMTELGKMTVDAHKEVGKKAAQVCRLLVTVGGRMKHAMESAEKHGLKREAIVHLKTAREAGEYVRDRIHRGDITLVKGSQAMRMERAVEKLLAHPEKATTLLARQDKQWLKIE